MAPICAIVPYLASVPGTASTGQAMVSNSASMFQRRNAGNDPGHIEASASRRPRGGRSGAASMPTQPVGAPNNTVTP